MRVNVQVQDRKLVGTISSAPYCRCYFRDQLAEAHKTHSACGSRSRMSIMGWSILLHTDPLLLQFLLLTVVGIEVDIAGTVRPAIPNDIRGAVRRGVMLNTSV
jgi:hypothetical protein